MEVTQVRRVRGIWYITLGGETLRIPRSLYEERPIAEGDEIDPEEYDQWLLLRQYRPGLEYAVSLLAQRPYAEGELEARMLRLGYRPVTDGRRTPRQDIGEPLTIKRLDREKQGRAWGKKKAKARKRKK